MPRAADAAVPGPGLRRRGGGTAVGRSLSSAPYHTSRGSRRDRRASARRRRQCAPPRPSRLGPNCGDTRRRCVCREEPGFFAGLCELADARRRLAASASPVIVLPRRVQLRATLLHVPCQCAPLRTPLSEPIAGFNLRPFARLLRGAAPADAVLLEHVRYDRLSDACVALELETAAEWAAPSFDGRECEVDDNSSEDSGDGDAATQRTWSFTAHMDVKAAGSANAVAFWTDCELQPDDGWCGRSPAIFVCCAASAAPRPHPVPRQGTPGLPSAQCTPPARALPARRLGCGSRRDPVCADHVPISLFSLDSLRA